MGSPTLTVSTFSEKIFSRTGYECKFFGSGKEWYGEMSNLPDRSLTRNFAGEPANAVTSTTMLLRVNSIARSVNAASRFDIG